MKSVNQVTMAFRNLIHGAFLLLLAAPVVMADPNELSPRSVRTIVDVVTEFKTHIATLVVDPVTVNVMKTSSSTPATTTTPTTTKESATTTKDATVAAATTADSSGNKVYYHYYSDMAIILSEQNKDRSAKGKDAFSWDETLSTYAGKYLASYVGCDLIHSKGPYGENLAGYQIASIGTTELMTALVKMWYDEGYSGELNHYTQLVWTASKRVGCAMKYCSDNWKILACEYDPVGNVIGQESGNV